MNEELKRCTTCDKIDEALWWCGNCDSEVTATNNEECCRCGVDLQQWMCQC